MRKEIFYLEKIVIYFPLIFFPIFFLYIYGNLDYKLVDLIIIWSSCVIVPILLIGSFFRAKEFNAFLRTAGMFIILLVLAAAEHKGPYNVGRELLSLFGIFFGFFFIAIGALFDFIKVLIIKNNIGRTRKWFTLFYSFIVLMGVLYVLYFLLIVD